MEAQAKQINQVVRGTIILTIAVLISKMLGFLYVIPLEHLIGLEGLALLNHGYTPYTVLLSLTTLGIPLAISKYVATENQLGNYRKGTRLLKRSFYLLLGLGVLVYLLVYLAAPFLAQFLHSPESTWVIRASASALLIVPAMAVLRGYFQGWQSMGPTGLSQVIEQLIRVVFFVVTSFILIKIGFSLEITVAVASLGTLAGAAGALLTLLVYWYKRREGIHQKVLASPKLEAQSLKLEYVELIRYALPISFVSLAIPLFSLVDLIFFKPILYSMGFPREEAINWFGILSSTAQKLIMVPISLATALSLSILPSLTTEFVQGNRTYIQKQTEQSLLLLLYIVVPASIGIFVLAEPLYTTLYSDASGISMLRAYAPAIITISLYTLTTSILQAVGKIKWSLFSLAAALITKMISMPILMYISPELGAIHATTIGFGIGMCGNFWGVLRAATLSSRFLFKSSFVIMLASCVMGIGVYFWQQLWNRLFLSSSLFYAVIQLLLSVVIGLVLYYLLTKKLPWVHALRQRFTLKRGKQETQD